MPELEPEPAETPDPSESTLEALREVTGLDEEEELLGNAESREAYRRMKERFFRDQEEAN